MFTRIESLASMQVDRRAVARRHALSRGGIWKLVAGSGILAVAAAFAAFTSPAWAAFGIEGFENSITMNEAGSLATQAGSHPYAMTTTMVFEHHQATPEQELGGLHVVPNGDPKNIEVNLPPGMIVNPTATPTRCTEAELENRGECPDSTAVGVATIDIGIIGVGAREIAPVFNMVPPPGVPAELGLVTGLEVIVHLVGKVRTGSDYGLSASVSNITQKAAIFATTITLWGDPSDSSHDKERGKCIFEEEFVKEGGSCPVERTDRTLLTMPSACTGEGLAATMSADSWQEPGDFALAESISPAVTGCEKLAFNPSLAVQPDTEAADSPSGLSVNLKTPQEEGPEGLPEANLKDAVVTLPVGMAVSPSAAAGLGACTPAEIGVNNASVPSCPESSKVATAEVDSPLLVKLNADGSTQTNPDGTPIQEPLLGSVYLAEQNDNPFGSLVALYLVAEGDGALVKLAGEVRLDPSTGQVTATFDNNPQLPFSELKLKFFGGPRAALVTPSGCGPYTTTSRLTPYSSETPAEPSSSFRIDAACGGGFAPSFVAGITNNQAGAYSTFALALNRHDGEQTLGGVTVQMPPGLLGKIAGVPLCGEPQAQEGACPAASKVGNVAVAVGAGPDPYPITGGQAYLTGPYNGAPYGLSIVVPAQAGPFDLGNEVVRAAIGIDPHTAAVTVVANPLPTIRDGIPFQLRTIEVEVNREGFIFNPTNCEAQTVRGTVVSTQGASVPASSPFQAANCANLPFKPSFSVSTQGNASPRGNGASLTVKVVQKAGEADIKSVHVELPRKLPSRLSTLQKACPEATFAANPASCPAASDVGTAIAHTPVLSVPLQGPAFFVSHGGAKFPELVLVLQGAGVTIDLAGETHIGSKTGITSSTFATVPDAPISSFELSLPERPNSVLSSTVGDLCGKSLAIPTAITGQNGAVIEQATKVSVTGCPKHKHKAKRKKRRTRG
jgi:hypothetical protein